MPLVSLIAPLEARDGRIGKTDRHTHRQTDRQTDRQTKYRNPPAGRYAARAEG